MNEEISEKILQNINKRIHLCQVPAVLSTHTDYDTNLSIQQTTFPLYRTKHRPKNISFAHIERNIEAKQPSIAFIERNIEAKQLSFALIERNIEAKQLSFALIERNIEAKQLSFALIERNIEAKQPSIAFIERNIEANEMFLPSSKETSKYISV